MRKRFLAVVVIAAFLGLAGCQKTDQKSVPFEYLEREDGTIMITGVKDNTIEEVVIPEKINGQKVTQISHGCLSLLQRTLMQSNGQ